MAPAVLTTYAPDLPCRYDGRPAFGLAGHPDDTFPVCAAHWLTHKAMGGTRGR